MADEIKITTQFKVDNGELTIPLQGKANVTVDQAVMGGPTPGLINVGTTEEVVSFAELATLGWCWMKNVDETNYVQWGPESAGAMVTAGRLSPGEPATLLRLEPGTTYRMKANTAACKVLVYGLNN